MNNRKKTKGRSNKQRAFYSEIRVTAKALPMIASLSGVELEHVEQIAQGSGLFNKLATPALFRNIYRITLKELKLKGEI